MRVLLPSTEQKHQLRAVHIFWEHLISWGQEDRIWGNDWREILGVQEKGRKLIIFFSLLFVKVLQRLMPDELKRAC